MSKPKQAGFTLIEIVLVVAISGMLLLVAFMGQGQLRAQAQFDAAVNKVVSSIAAAHTEANAAVNLSGSGTGVSDCGSSNSTNYVFGGVAWVADPSGSYHIDFYKVVPQSASANDGCVFSSSAITMPAPILINAAHPALSQGAKEVFIRNNDVLNICPVTDNSVDLGTLFRAGNCAEGNLTLTVTDDQGRTAQVTVDKSGLAKRDF